MIDALHLGSWFEDARAEQEAMNAEAVRAALDPFGLALAKTFAEPAPLGNGGSWKAINEQSKEDV